MSKDFALGDILSITTGALVSRRKMEGVYDILNYMTGLTLWPHQLPWAADACTPDLLTQCRLCLRRGSLLLARHSRPTPLHSLDYYDIIKYHPKETSTNERQD